MKKIILYVVTSIVGLYLMTGTDFISKSNLQAQNKDVKGKVENVKKEADPGKSGNPENKDATNKKDNVKLLTNGMHVNNKDDLTKKQKGESLFTTVKQGGPLMVFILILALVSLTIIIERIIYFTKNDIWKIHTLEHNLKNIAQTSSAKYREDIEDELRSEFQVYANSTERGLALLSGIGNISPLVGFLGTVIGMIDAFASIAAATTVNAKVVAVGIQIALVTTAGGLLVAAPTLAFFYFFNHVIQNRYAFAEELITDLSESYPRLSIHVEDKDADAYNV